MVSWSILACRSSLTLSLPVCLPLSLSLSPNPSSTPSLSFLKSLQPSYFLTLSLSLRPLPLSLLSRYEDSCRQLLGNSSYTLFGLDKVIQQTLKCLQVRTALSCVRYTLSYNNLELKKACLHTTQLLAYTYNHTAPSCATSKNSVSVTVLFYTVLYCIVSYCVVLYCVAL